MTHFNNISKSIQAIDEKKPYAFVLDQFGSLYVHGKDAASFLQGLLTCDLNMLEAFKAQPTGCCNLQGRLVALLFIMAWQDGYLLVLPREILDTTLKHFKKYALFSKVVFDKNTIESFTGFLGSSPEDAYSCLNNLFIKPNITAPDNALCSEAWHYQQMKRGFPNISIKTQETFLPHRIGLDKIEGAISFKKGCYLGQEIIARTHFKAVQKHAIYLCETHVDLQPGDDLLSEAGENMAKIIDVVHLNESLIHCLATIKINSIEKLSPNIHRLKKLY